MRKPVILFTLLWLFYYPLAAQLLGCTDPLATNDDPSATVNNGSCTYAPTNYTLPLQTPLAAQINENSGLVYIKGDLWTFNDSGNAAALYKINQNSGNILRTVPISNASNIDWEDITADAQYVYIGDFGNNTNGNRQDLKIYKVAIADLYGDPALSVEAAVINYSYADQTDFTPKGNNRTEFDCEAFFVKNNQLHLFSKDWVGQNYETKHYTLPTIPGTHVATLRETYHVKGSITGADISKNNVNEVVLIGYDVTNGNLFMWLLFDYRNDLFFSGNKRRIELGRAISFGQIEGVVYTGEGIGYISSESVDILNLPARLYNFTSLNWVPLPVDLLHFKGRYTAPNVHLTWQTASETESDYFAVEWSADGLLFEEVHRHKAAGSSHTPISYTVTVRVPFHGTQYYRLRMVDKNGTFTYSTVVAIEAVSGDNLEVSPVPARRGETIKILYGTSTGPVQLRLQDMQGKIYIQKNYHSQVIQEFTLDTTHLQPGIYILQVVDLQKISIKKILIL